MVEPNRKNNLREQFNISRLAIQYSWLTLGFWMAVVVAGVLAFSSLKYALFPDITFPVVVINASAPLNTALETEAQLTQPIEQQLRGLAGLEDIDSVSYSGRSIVTLSFAVGTNLNDSSRSVEMTLKQTQLPERTDLNVIPINLNESAVISYAIESSSKKLSELIETTQDDVIPAIANLPGVLKVTLLGEAAKLDAARRPDQLSGATAVLFDGREALAIQVIKRGDANTLDVVREVEDKVKQIQSDRLDLQITQAATQADYIRAATQETIRALIEAIVLSVLIIFPFLRSWRATLISALVIPIALLGTFIVMAVYQFNLETLTLLALAMVIGSVIDDAIVDVENIARHIEQGETPRQAAILATNEIGLTVTAATLTAVAVFLPVGMMGGVLGQFFKPFGITISAAMITSLLVARTLSPLLAAYWLKPNKSQAHQDAPRQDWLTGLTHRYRHWLEWSLRHRGVVVSIALLSFIAGLALIPLIPKGFIPKLDRGEFNITYLAPLPEVPPELRSGAIAPSLTSSSAAASPNEPISPPLTPFQLAELQLLELQMADFDPLAESLQIAQQLDRFVRKSPQVETVFTIVGSRQGEPNKGTLYVKLKHDRTVTTAELQDQFREQLPKLPQVTTSVEDIQFVDTGGEKPVQIRMTGEDLTALNRTAQALKARLKKLPGFADVTATGGNQGNSIVEINRLNQRRVATISANLGQELTIGEASDRATAAAKALLPAGISLELGGDSARVNEILGSFGMTLGLSVLCIILVLFLLFRSAIDTLVIFLSLPLSIVGAMLGLLIVQSDFGMISLIGIIFLLGLTNKNAILIVDYIKQLRRSGMSRREAILTAGPVRLRPILMTTAATILGMLPLALGFGAGAELRTPMAVAIMGGLVTSTLLSLLVVPVIYDLLDGWRSSLKKTIHPQQ
jgi:multidrug efflux pump subunit AcrB